MTSCIVGLQMGILQFVLLLGIQVHNDELYCGIENGPAPDCSSSYFSFFYLSRFFVKDIPTTV